VIWRRTEGDISKKWWKNAKIERSGHKIRSRQWNWVMLVSSEREDAGLSK
jgi:hypothetical protein